MSEANTVLKKLKISLQQRAGTDYKIEEILGLNPVMTEAKVVDRVSNRPFCARFYRVPPDQREYLNQAWQMCEPGPGDPPRKLPQPSFGLKPIGEYLSHVAAYIPGMDLATYLHHVGPCHSEFAVRLGVRLLRILGVLESQNLFPVYLEPSQLILARDGHLFLKNSALSIFETAIARKLELPSIFDIRYAAPEQVEGKDPSVASLIYQTGILLFEIVAGQPPFTGDYETVKEAQLEKPVSNPQALNKNVAVGLVRVLARALAKKPEHRFKNLVEFKQTLEYLLPALERAGSLGTSPKPERLPDREEARVKSQLDEAKGYCVQKDYQAALRTVESLMMVTGPREDVVALSRKIWQAMYGGLIGESLEKASEAADQGQYGQALEHLNHLFSMHPTHQRALELQANLFDKLAHTVVVDAGPIPLRTYQEKASEAKAAGNPDLAEGLWSQVMLMPENGSKTVRIEKQLAGPELAELQASLPREPVVEAPRPTPPPELEEEMVSVEDLNLDDLDDFSGSPKEVAPPADVSGDVPEALDSTLREEMTLQTPKAPASRKKMFVTVGLASAAVIVLGLVFGTLYMKKKKFREEAVAAYNAADEIEAAGDWDAALQAWARINTEYPDFDFPEADGAERYKTLEYKIRDRQSSIQKNLDKTEALLADEETPIREMQDNPLNYLGRTRDIDPENERAAALFAVVRERVASRARRLFEARKVEEARETYRYLRSIDPDYRDEALEADIEEWVRTKIVEPKLAKLDKAIKSRRWEEAFEITEQLRGNLEDPKPLRERWDRIYAVYEKQYNDAREKKKKNKMLAALEVMTEIRPENNALRKERDELNRELNLKRILGLENETKAALKKGNLKKAGQAALRLRKLESDNGIAKDAITRVRTSYERRIEAQKKDDPRAALQSYNPLIAILNWKMHRQGREKLANRINQFDSQVDRIKKVEAKVFAERKAALDRLIADYKDFVRDDRYKWLETNRDQLVEDQRRLTRLMKWETGVRDDVTQPFSKILDRLNRGKPFRFLFAKRKVAQLKDSYRERIANYTGNVTLVIKGARNLPKGKGTFKKGPKAYCRLKVGGETFTTDVAGNNRNPRWVFSATFNAKKDAALSFSVYNKKGNELIGAIHLPKVPPNGKDIMLKPEQGNWSLMIDVKRER